METSGTVPTNETSLLISAVKAQDYLDNYVSDCVNNKGETAANIAKSFRIDRAAIEDILSDENCVYLRVYLGKPTVSGDPTALFVGVDRYNENLLDTIYNNAVSCPNQCPGKHFN